MTEESTNSKIQIGKSTYESPRVECVEVQTEGGFAASESVSSNSQNGVVLDTWTKTTGSDTDTWSD
jgi:hypothetical protein